MNFFTNSELLTLESIVDRIIPADDYPSGWEAGVGDYIQLQLGRESSGFLSDLQAGLASIEAESQLINHKCFSSLSDQEQDHLLTNIGSGKVAASWSIKPVPFFENLVNLCGEGFYGNPENGGNKDSISWKKTIKR